MNSFNNKLTGVELTGFVPRRLPRNVHNDSDTTYQLDSTFSPAGDQPQAIKALIEGITNKERDQMLLGITGSGKTYTMAKVIEKTKRPALILAPNKTLAAQLFGEFRTFFPHNNVEYFVSYYDYFQPEAYIPRSDTYIEKDSSINEQIDRMRHSATRAALEYRDVIIVASVSCIYGIGAVENYMKMAFIISKNDVISRKTIIDRLVELQYKRNEMAFQRGNFRAKGDTLEIFPAHFEDRAWRVSLFGDDIEKIVEFDPLTGETKDTLDSIKIYANSHYVTPGPTLKQAVENIKYDLKKQLDIYTKENKLLEAQRLEQRTMFDIEMITATGSCAGIENYSRYLTGRAPGDPPPTLFEYITEDTIIFVDESHVTIPQFGGMYRGDFQRKTTLTKHGFRLPSCLDNRPLKFEEWNAYRTQTIYVSATPGDWEINQTQGVVIEQIIRPTGLLDPVIEVRPAKNQVEDLIGEAKNIVKAGNRILVTTLTKRMSEDLTEYMHEEGLRVRYMHSDIDTLERIEIIRDLRLGAYDILVGINLLREGLDIPECSLVAILDADKEGFLRSEKTLIQTIGRAARNVNGRAILYADQVTRSMEKAIKETERRRKKQSEYNKNNNIIPATIHKKIADITTEICDETYQKETETILDIKAKGHNLQAYIEEQRTQMFKAAQDMEFEEAARLRDEIKQLENNALLLIDDLSSKTYSQKTSTTPRSISGKPGTRKLRSKNKNSVSRKF